jgi:DNA-binding MarR family transcriptional regulator
MPPAREWLTAKQGPNRISAMGVRRAKQGVGEVAGRIWGECTAYRLRVINRAVSRIYDDALRPYRLRIAQLNTLVVVMQTGGLTPNDLSQRMHMDASTVSRNVERMCKSGWLELADIDDARSHEIRITNKGMKLIADVAPAWEAAQAEAEQLLGVQISRAIAKGADRLVEEGER